MKDLFALSDGSVIQLKGFIDRIDRLPDGALRIIDYKTGAGLSDFRSMDSLFDQANKERPKAVMQVFMYALMYSRQPDNASLPLQPAIYYLRTLFSPAFSPAVYFHPDRNTTTPVDRFAPFAADFEAALRNCLDEIFRPDAPFIQTSIDKACTYCSFNNLCGRA